MSEKLDKAAFKKQSFKEAEQTRAYWMKKSWYERLVASYRLSLRVYGYDPDHPPAMDKTQFSKRTRK